jgi:ribosomal protein L11 methyltransferase
MDYIQLTVNIESENLQLVQEMLMHELVSIDYESFVETSNGLIAYIPKPQFNEGSLSNIHSIDEMNLGKINFDWELIKDKNWNEEWEKNFQPVLIGKRCYIRAPFHEKKANVDYQIVIEPKMAFGTGHHETTSLMIEHMLSLSFSGMRVLDMGCGSGVLAIMASKLGASDIYAVDIDEWSYYSTVENAVNNQVTNITAVLGGIEKTEEKHFDIILANINRNILLDQLQQYSATIAYNGLLLLSGIYKNDLDVIIPAALKKGFKHLKTLEKNNWVAALFIKI